MTTIDIGWFVFGTLIGFFSGMLISIIRFVFNENKKEKELNEWFGKNYPGCSQNGPLP